MTPRAGFSGGLWLPAWLGVLATALVLTVLVELDQVPDEVSLTRDIQAWSFPGQDLSDAVRRVTGTEAVIAAGVGLALLHLLTRDRLAALLLVALVVLTPVTQSGLKELVDRPRPVQAGIEERAPATSPSFPAGHVMSPTAVYGGAAGLLLLRRGAPPADRIHRDRSEPRRSIRPALTLPLSVGVAALLLLSGIANVYLGVHWPTDVLGAYLWGLVLVIPAIAMYDRFRLAG